MEQGLPPEIGKVDRYMRCAGSIDNSVMSVIKLTIACWVCFKTLLLQETCKILKLTSGVVLCIFGNRTLVPISLLRKKQTAVSHSGTEADITSLDV